MSDKYLPPPPPNKPIISTDPPYYDNIGYSDLSDFFYVWAKRSLRHVYPGLFHTLLTPKSNELIASPYRHEGDSGAADEFFESGLKDAFTSILATQAPDIPTTVYYAFKQSESTISSTDSTEYASTGWETMLAGLLSSGFRVTSTIPMRTEMSSRMIGQGTNALASSIVLVCRPRPENAPSTTRQRFAQELRSTLPEALRQLQHGNIAPVDLAQAAIGPGMAVFSKYTRVLESDGRAMAVRTALQMINQTLDEVLAEQEGDVDADTRWALAWYEQFGMEEGLYGTAETLSNAKNTSVSGLAESGIVRAQAGRVRLLRRDELSSSWQASRDRRLSVWEATQRLIRALEQQGEAGAAAIAAQVGDRADRARDLAYRLYVTSERKGRAQEALGYNSLVVAWPAIVAQMQAQADSADTERQASLI